MDDDAKQAGAILDQLTAGLVGAGRRPSGVVDMTIDQIAMVKVAMEKAWTCRHMEVTAQAYVLIPVSAIPPHTINASEFRMRTAITCAALVCQACGYVRLLDIRQAGLGPAFGMPGRPDE